MKNHWTVLTQDFVTILNVPVTKRTIATTINHHPDPPGLLIVSEAIRLWGVETEAIEVTLDKMTDSDFPCIALMTGNRCVILKKIVNGRVKLKRPGKRETSMSVEEFGADWTGIVLLATPRPDAGEKGYWRKAWKERFLKLRNYAAPVMFALLSVLVMVPALRSEAPTADLLPVVIAKFAGLTACIFLFFVSIGFGKVATRVCPTQGKISCHSVISSPAGKILGIPMTDLGLLYFSGGLSTIFFAAYFGELPSALMALAVVNVLTLPYTIFSVVYQGVVLKVWCWLCLTVQAVFWIEFSFMHKRLGSGTFGLLDNPPLSVIPGFLFPLLIWLFLRQLLGHARELEMHQRELVKLRRNPSVIQSLLNGGHQVDMRPDSPEISIGPKEAPATLTVILTFDCGYCRTIYQEVRRLLDRYSNLNARVRLLLNNQLLDDVDRGDNHNYRIAATMVALILQDRHDDAVRALDDWFLKPRIRSKKDILKWLHPYESSITTGWENAHNLLRLYHDWTIQNGITDTPTTLLNGHKLPIEIRLADLEYFLMRQE